MGSHRPVKAFTDTLVSHWVNVPIWPSGNVIRFGSLIFNLEIWIRNSIGTHLLVIPPYYFFFLRNSWGIIKLPLCGLHFRDLWGVILRLEFLFDLALFCRGTPLGVLGSLSRRVCGLLRRVFRGTLLGTFSTAGLEYLVGPGYQRCWDSADSSWGGFIKEERPTRVFSFGVFSSRQQVVHGVF